VGILENNQSEQDGKKEFANFSTLTNLYQHLTTQYSSIISRLILGLMEYASLIVLNTAGAHHNLCGCRERNQFLTLMMTMMKQTFRLQMLKQTQIKNAIIFLKNKNLKT